jgi:NAD(P)H-flavin reductase
MAAGEAPQYTKRLASVVSNTEVGKAAYMIRVKAEDGGKIHYQPGHVLALEIPDSENVDGEWMRGPYTVSRVDETSFDVLYKVVGKKTETFRQAKVGETVKFGGKFKVPILEGINKDNLERVVGIATGTGIGPLIGFAEQALSQPDYPRIDLFVAFRELDDICCAGALDELVNIYNDRFTWTPVLSSVTGHISTPENLKLITNGATKAGTTHFHMIGNGAMVNEWTAGLAEAGVPKERVTLEMYFNHKATPRPEAIKAISEALKEVTLVS